MATALGVAAGVGLGAVLVSLSARIFATEHNRFDLFFTLKSQSLVQSFAIAFVVALATIVGTSLRVSRLNIIRAIRDLAEPPPRGRRVGWLVAGVFGAAAGVALTLQGWTSQDGLALLLGPTLAVVGLAPLGARLLRPSTSHSIGALLVVVWGASLFALVPDSTRGASVMLYVLQGIVLTTAAVTLVSFQQERLSRALRFVTGGRSLSLRLGLAYPLAIMDEGYTMTRQIFQLFQGYLAMGLIVGIAGTAVVMVRAVRERRRQIGTLRALGFGARPVGRSFAIETGFVAAEGTLIGAVLALVTLYDIVALSDSFGQMTFSVPYVSLAVLLLGTVAASLLATVWPTIAASRIRPAVALRMTD